MAAYYPTNKASGTGVQQNIGGVSRAAAVWEVGSATLGTADTLYGPTVPAGSIITNVALAATDLDTGSSVGLNVGDSTSTARFISGSTIGRTGEHTIDIASTGAAYKYTAATQLNVTVSTASNGGVAGGTVALVVDYVVLEATT
jgi:hypothetical protein